VRIFIQFLFVIGHVLFIDMAFSENIEFRNTTDDMVIIPSGKFKMGCNQFGPMHGAPEHFVYLNHFMIDRFEVTNKRFEEIIPDHKRRRSKLSKCDKCPVTNVSWDEAVDYCYLTGKTLPTEAQWEKSAGSGDGCAFPWGYGFDPIHSQGRGGLETITPWECATVSTSCGFFPLSFRGMSFNAERAVVNCFIPTNVSNRTLITF
jgi:hypothetical protein